MDAKPSIEGTRLVGVDMNLSGAWRSLGTFNLDKADIDAVLDGAEAIVVNQANGTGGKLRIVDAADERKPVLMYWSQAKSWEEARHAGR